MVCPAFRPFKTDWRLKQRSFHRGSGLVRRSSQMPRRMCGVRSVGRSPLCHCCNMRFKMDICEAAFCLDARGNGARSGENVFRACQGEKAHRDFHAGRHRKHFKTKPLDRKAPFQNVCPHDERACKIRKQTCRQENLHKRRCSQTDSAADKETLPTGESFRLMEGYRLQLILIFQQRLANPPRNLCRLAKAFAFDCI